ncbi:hypothetical protein Rhopal_002318-T1 [Rhodotorula paludigena]|uniref:TECPR1-like DysF domain-containing protein n=1 Tax=Rhodotorula paludigena TaxID=86838 RepID=A0AAV5GGK9_9BASI|nr:hypothetical protein Rhopal_002318-T1 [Rhodotorula paludigena]
MKALPSLAGPSQAASSPTRQPTLASPLVSSTTPPASEEPSPTDLLLATPPALLKLFALSAPVIHAAATFVQLVTWTHPSFFSSLLVLLAWWSVCLFGYWVALYGVNAVILALLLQRYLTAARRGKGAPPSSMRHRSRPATLSPAAYAQLISSAHILAEHIQSFRTNAIHPLSLHFSLTPLRPSTPAPAYETAWLLVTSYPFYLALTYAIPLRYLFLLAGTVAILWQAPFFTTLRALLWRSAFVRWACRLFVGILRGGKGVRTEWARTQSGIGIAGLIGKQGAVLGGRGRAAGAAAAVEEKPVKKPRSSISPTTPEAAAEEAIVPEEHAVEEGEDVQVQFTVFENQRTDSENNPANPPASFALPPASVAYIPSPTKSDPHSRLKKTTEWRWLDPEWHVLRSALPSVTLPVGSGSGGGGAPVAPDGTAGGAAAGAGSAPASNSAANPPSPTFARTFGALASQASNALSSHSSSPAPSSPPPAPSAPSSLLSSAAALTGSHSGVPTASPSYTSASELSYADSPLFAAWQVDDEGWQYGDNHFEKMGPRGGLGRYTRRRAWVRRAGLVERTERVPGELAPTAAAAANGATKDEAAKKDKPAGGSARRTSSGAGGSGSRSGAASSALRGESARRRKSTLPGGAGGEKDGAGEGVTAGGG